MGLFMITEKGVVERIIQEKAVVRVQQSSSCATCEARSACNVKSDKEMLVEVENVLSAGEGDCVEISMPARSLIKTGMLVYLFPVLALIIGAGAGNAGAGYLGMEPNLASIIGAALALGISFGALKGIERSARNKREYQPRMTRLLVSARSRGPSGDSR
jgi:sigma-E factor negative regulatory protein RseC